MCLKSPLGLFLCVFYLTLSIQPFTFLFIKIQCAFIGQLAYLACSVLLIQKWIRCVFVSRNTVQRKSTANERDIFRQFFPMYPTVIHFSGVQKLLSKCNHSLASVRTVRKLKWWSIPSRFLGKTEASGHHRSHHKALSLSLHSSLSSYPSSSLHCFFRGDENSTHISELSQCSASAQPKLGAGSRMQRHGLGCCKDQSQWGRHSVHK